jgi:ligand-binding sensor domain-containing protein
MEGSPRAEGRLFVSLVVLLSLVGTTPATAGWRVFPGNEFRDLAESPDGQLWIATDAGAQRFDGSRWVTVASPVGPDLRRVLVDRTGAPWTVSFNRGVARFDGVSWGLPGGIAALPDSQGRAILEDRQGDVWIGFVNGLAWFRRAAAQWTWFDTSNSGLVRNNVEQILEDGEGALWFASGQAGGLSVLDPTRSTWRREQVRPGGLARDSVISLGLDDDGSVWCGSFGGASRRRPDGTWRHFTRAQGLPSDSIAAIAGDGRGGVWFGADNGGIGHYDGRSFRVERWTPAGQPIGAIRSMLVDRASVLWLGTGGGGLLRTDGVEWRTAVALPLCASVSTPPARTQVVLERNPVLAQHEDGSGNLWFAPFASSVATLDTTGRWSTLSRAPGRPMPDSVAAILEGRDGLLHFGALGAGVATLDRRLGTVTAATRSEGLASDSITVLFEDSAGDVWAGGFSGLSRRHLGAWSALPGLRGEEIRQVVEDGSGVLWVWTGAGIARVAPDRVTVTALDLGANTIQAAARRPLCRRADGTIWIGLTQGLFRIEADALVPVAGTADVRLRERLRNLSEDPAGGLWTTSLFGAAHLASSVWSTYLAGTGQPIAATPVAPVHVDRRGIAWVPTDLGVSRFNGRGWLLVAADAGLAADQVDEILEDHRGHLWFRGPCGATEHAVDSSAPQTILDLRPDSISVRRDATIAYGFFGDEEVVDYEHRLDTDPWSGFEPATSFTVAGLDDGPHHFEVRARDASGNVDATPAVFDWHIDATPPAARIVTPPSQAVVRGDTTIVGTTADLRLRRWRVDFKPADGSWATDSTGLAPWTTDGRDEASLAAWDTRGVADGLYDVRLTVQDDLGLEAIDDVRVLVDNVAPFADVTSPRVVTREDGGEVFTAAGDARLYLPPGGLDHDAQVGLVGSSTLLREMLPLPPGTVALRRWLEVTWTGAQLLKPATLEVLRAGPAPAPGSALAIYRFVAGEGWTRLGGTPADSSALRLAIEDEGRYVVLEESSVDPGGASTLSGLSFSPRILSPGGSVGAGSLAIAFTLGRAAPVDVRVYNRAGRLVRDVARGISFPTGANLVSWDGLDHDGRAVRDGLYVVTVEAVGVRLSNTVAVVR